MLGEDEEDDDDGVEDGDITGFFSVSGFDWGW